MSYVLIDKLLTMFRNMISEHILKQFSYSCIRNASHGYMDNGSIGILLKKARTEDISSIKAQKSIG